MKSNNEIARTNNNIPHQFDEVMEMIKVAKQKVFAAVNTSLIDLYWQVGSYISHQIDEAGWGKSVVEELANYIRTQEPNSEGFSKQNLWRMKQFYETYKDAPEILSTLLREITWSHNTLIMSHCKTVEEREFYLRMAIKERYSYRELERQIDSSLYERFTTNQIKLSPLLREIAPKAESVFRDHYVMEFVGEQNGKPENPEHLGQLNFYLEALDRDVKKPHENPSIGVLLCKSKDDEVVEYALSRSLSPTLVAEYELKLPDKALLQRKMQELAEFMDGQD